MNLMKKISQACESQSSDDEDLCGHDDPVSSSDNDSDDESLSSSQYTVKTERRGPRYYVRQQCI